jgi:hypothetical protein
MRKGVFWLGVATLKILFGAGVLSFYLAHQADCDYAAFAGRWAEGCTFTFDYKTDGFICLTWPLWAASGGNVFVMNAMLGLFALTGAWAGAEAMRVFGGLSHRQTRIALSILIFAPSVWLWTSLPGKEAFVSGVAGWTLYAWARLRERRYAAGVILLLLATSAGAWVRPYWASSAALTLPFLTFVRRPQIFVVVPAAVLVGAAALCLYPRAANYVFEYASLHRYYALQDWGNTAFDIGIFVPDFWGVAKKIPAALAAAFVRPYPAEAYPAFLVPMKIEAALFAATLVVFRPPGWAWPLVLFGVAYGAFVALSIPHFGTLWRHKTYYLPWLWAAVAIGAPRFNYSFFKRKPKDESPSGR